MTYCLEMLRATQSADTGGRAERRVEDVADRLRAAWRGWRGEERYGSKAGGGRRGHQGRGEVGQQGGSRTSRTPGATAAGWLAEGEVRGGMPALIVEVLCVVAALIAESTLISLRCHRWAVGRTFVFSRRSDCTMSLPAEHLFSAVDLIVVWWM